MAGTQRKLMTIKDIGNELICADYKKLKAFCLENFNYKKIGNVYYFNRKEVESVLLDNKTAEYRPVY